MATAILDPSSGIKGKATVRYSGVLTPMAEGDTIGLTVGSTAHLHTVPAGGQTLREALRDLSAIINAHADGDGASQAANSEFDQCLHVQGAGGANVVVSLPVYVVA